MSRNEDRFASLNIEDAPDARPQPNSTVPFSFAVPTEIVDLPTRGRFYPKEHSLFNKKTLEIRYMTAKDEDILTSRSLLSQGIALDRLVESVLVDKTINIRELPIVDKNAILIAARITGYGSQFDTKVLCPSCTAENSVSIELSETLETVNIELIENEDVSFEDGIFYVDLESIDIRVGFRPMFGFDEEWINESNKMKTKHNLPETPLTDMLRRMIVSVNGNEDPNIINKLIEALPALEARRIRKAYNESVPNIEIKNSFTCNSCGHSAEMEVPLNADFFWPG